MTSMMPRKAIPSNVSRVTKPRSAAIALRPDSGAQAETVASGHGLWPWPMCAVERPKTWPIGGRAWQWMWLFGEAATHGADNALGFFAELPSHALTDAQPWIEAMALHLAVLERVLALQVEGHNACSQWMSEYTQLKQVSSLSNLMVQEYNLAAQWAVLGQEQLTRWVELMENVQVGYGYWMTQQRQPTAQVTPSVGSR